ncbi:MAG TPA: hypothetical protein DCX06_04515 [Opitutae bacterium]|nr:hypothetical protein [Opitutae bacterium]
MCKSTICKLGLAGITSALALLIPFRVLSTDEATIIIKHYGMWLTLATTLLFLFELRQPIKDVNLSSLKELLRNHWVAVVVILIATVYLHSQIDDSFKILYDEYTLSSTAMNMHTNGWASVQTASHQIDGEIVSAVGFVDKRPILFPFLIAIAHQLTGYTAENVFWVNTALTTLLLSLLYSIAVSFSSKRHALLSIILLVSLPLLAQNTNGGGYELLNACLIASLLIFGIQYLKNPKNEGLNLLVLNAILLASTRYESLLYTLVPVILWIIKSSRTRRIELTWFTCISPLLLITPLLSYSIFKGSAGFIQTTAENFFSLDHFPGNFKAATAYLFNTNGDHSNSILLSITGILSLLASTRLLLKRPPVLRDHLPAFAAVFSIITLNTLLALTCYWGEWTDPSTSRFSLPLQFILAIMPALALYHIFHVKRLHLAAIISAILFTLVISSHINQRIQSEPRLLVPTGNHWALTWLTENIPAEQNLIISDGCIGIQLYHFPAIPIQVANQLPKHVIHLKDTGFYEDIYVVEAFVGGTTLKTAQTPPNATPLSKDYVLKPVAQKAFSTNAFYRISQVVELRPNTSTHSPEPPSTVPSIDDPNAYRDYLDKALPLVTN